MNIRYRVDLTQDERSELMSLLSSGKHGSRKLKRAQILLAADSGAGDGEIERCVGASGSTVYRTKRRFVEAGVAGECPMKCVCERCAVWFRPLLAVFLRRGYRIG